MLDSFVHLATTPKLAFIAKKEMRSYPGIGGVAAAIGCIFIERQKSK